MARISIDRGAVPARRDPRSSRRRASVRSARPRGSSQQTLTQIDFVRYLPTEDVDLESDDAVVSPRPKRRRRDLPTTHSREGQHFGAEAAISTEENPTEGPAQGSKLPRDRMKDEIPSTPPPGCESDESTPVSPIRSVATRLKASRSPLRESSVNIQATRTPQARRGRNAGIGKGHPHLEVRESCAGLAESLPKEPSRVEYCRRAGVRHGSTASNEQVPTGSTGPNLRDRRDENVCDENTPTCTEKEEVAQTPALKHHGRMEIRDSEGESSEEETPSEPRTPAVRPAAPFSSTLYLAAARQSSCDPSSRDGQPVETDSTVGRAPLPMAIAPPVEVNSSTSIVQPLSEPLRALARPTSSQNTQFEAGTWDDKDVSRFVDSYDEAELALEPQHSPCPQPNSTGSPSEQLHRETLQSQQLGHLPGSEPSPHSSQSNEDLKQSPSDDAQDLDDLDVEPTHLSKRPSSPTATLRHPPTVGRDDAHGSPKSTRPGSAIEVDVDVDEDMDVDAEIVGQVVVDEDHLFDSLTASQLLPETLMRALLPMPPSSPTQGTTQGMTQDDDVEELRGLSQS
ncbi:MAG: hypothetical protein M1815_000974 [Lichina confinis]|nr:MAG: hypothetical protein M1815_000974 [Lichina confinis]